MNDCTTEEAKRMGDCSIFILICSEWWWSDCAGMAYDTAMCGDIASGVNRVRISWKSAS